MTSKHAWKFRVSGLPSRCDTVKFSLVLRPTSYACTVKLLRWLSVWLVS